MKLLFTLTCILVCFFNGIAQSTAHSADKLNSQAQSKQNNEVKQEVTGTLPTAPEVVALKESEFDFGKIAQGKPVTHVFLFTNTGKTPLVLDNVQASCGCTTPEWSKEAVAPGETSKITVGYNAANEGAFTKSITLTYNGTQSKQINIKGNVWKTPATSAPENPELAILKNQQ